MLQRGFTDPHGSLFHYDKSQPEKGIGYNTPKPIFFEEHLYSTIDDKGEFDTTLEDAFGRVEDKAARIIKKIVTAARSGKNPNLSLQERTAWDIYVQGQFKRVPDHLNPLSVGADEELDRILAEFQRERGVTVGPDDRAKIARNARNDALGLVDPDVAAFLARLGLVVAVIDIPKKAFILGSSPLVSYPRPGLTKLGPREWWLPITSGVAVSPGGRPDSERVVRVTDARAIRRFNEIVWEQSTMVAGCSRELIASLVSRR